MSFPTVAASVQSTQSTNSLTFSLALPTGISSGDLLLAMVGKRLIDAITWPSGWTTAPTGWTDQTNSTTVRHEIRYRIADGTETSPISLSTSVACRWEGVVFRITGYTGVPEAAGANGNSTNANPPNLAPSFGAVDALWIATAAWDGVPGSGFPANYSDNAFSPNTGFTQMMLASRNLNAASENPGTFTSTTEQWGAGTIAVQGAAAGGVVIATPSFLTLGVGT